jgi:hypothetical protein
MPTYNPKDMAYVLQMSKSSGKYTPEEMALMQDINRNVAGGAMTNMPVQGQPQGQPVGQPMGQPQAMPQGVPMNRLAQLQAAANAQLAGQGDAANPNMGNIAKYFQGRQ